MASVITGTSNPILFVFNDRTCRHQRLHNARLPNKERIDSIDAGWPLLVRNVAPSGDPLWSPSRMSG